MHNLSSVVKPKFRFANTVTGKMDSKGHEHGSNNELSQFVTNLPIF
jgi:hypothetical protein